MRPETGFLSVQRRSAWLGRGRPDALGLRLIRKSQPPGRPQCLQIEGADFGRPIDVERDHDAVLRRRDGDDFRAFSAASPPVLRARRFPRRGKSDSPTTPMTTAMPRNVATPESSISQRTLSTMRCAAGSRWFFVVGRRIGTCQSLTSAPKQSSRAAEDAGARLDRVLAARIEGLSRTRLKALILDGAVTIGGRTILDPEHRVNAADAHRSQRAGGRRSGAEGRKHPAQYRLRGRRSHCDRQARRPRGASGARAFVGHIGQCADRALRRHAVGHRRGEAAGHRASARQGHHRPSGGRQERPRAPEAERAIRRSRPRRPAACANISPSPGARPAGPKGTIDAPIDRHPHARDKMAVRQNGREAITHWALAGELSRYRRQAGRELHRLPARNRPDPPDPGPSRPCRAIRCLATRPTAPATGPRPSTWPPRPRRPLRALEDRPCMLILLGFEHPIYRRGAAVPFGTAG